jgi:NADPH:quinone reductase-like Zn-dependent oxidoreductase
MKAVRILDYNQIPSVQDVERPGAPEGGVLVRVEAAALNPLDVLIQSGAMAQWFPTTFPLTVGSDLAGVVEAVGAGVQAFRPGDRVIARPDPAQGGALADYAAVPVDTCVPLPPGMTAADGAAIPTAGATAWKALFDDGRLVEGETVLIHAGAGGVGSFAVQMAHAAGARVIATASGPGIELVRELGADHVIDYTTQDFAVALSGIDLVLDLVGGETQARSYGVLREGGRLVSTVHPPTGGAVPGVEARMMHLDLDNARLSRTVEKIASHGIRVVVDSVFPIQRFDSAWQRLVSRQAKGKIIVSMRG